MSDVSTKTLRLCSLVSQFTLPAAGGAATHATLPQDVPPAHCLPLRAETEIQRRLSLLEPAGLLTAVARAEAYDLNGIPHMPRMRNV